MNSVLIRKILPYAVIFLGVAYGLWPVDIIPDIPFAGWVDDAGVIGAAAFIAIRLLSGKKSPPAGKQDHSPGG